MLMDWSNPFTLGGFIVSYCTFQLAWEVIGEKDDYKLAYHWFPNKQKAEEFLPWTDPVQVVDFSFLR